MVPSIYCFWLASWCISIIYFGSPILFDKAITKNCYFNWIWDILHTSKLKYLL